MARLSLPQSAANSSKANVIGRSANEDQDYKGPTDHEILALLPHAVIAQSVFNMIQWPNKGWEWPAID